MPQRNHVVELGALPPQVDAALQTEGAENFFLSRPWFDNYLTTVQPSRAAPLILCAQTESGCAVLPMKQYAGWVNGITVRTLFGAQNYYSCLFGPAVAGAHTPELYDRLLGAAIASRPDTLDLHPLDPASPSFDAMQAALRRHGWLVDTYFCFGNWQHAVNGQSFADYFNTLPSKLKNTIRRKRQALDKAGNARLEIITGGDDVERLITDYTTIYHASWKQPEPYPDFMPGLIRTCARHGWLRGGIAYVGNQPAAAQIWIVHNGQALIYKLAYDEQFGKLSIGSILTTLLMERVIDVDRVQLIDYLMGDEPYKRDWMSCRNERRGIIAYNPRTLAGLLGAARHFGGKWLRRLRQRTTTKAPPDDIPD